VDPIGACVGLRGTRIQVISRELRGEKIDIVEWSPDAATFVARALSPAKVSSVTISEPDAEGGQPSVLVIVPDSQLSLAIGKRGQNARLAAKLTGLRVDIKSESEVEDERRREEEELAQGRQFLSAFPDVTPPIQDALIAAGLAPRRASREPTWPRSPTWRASGNARQSRFSKPRKHGSPSMPRSPRRKRRSPGRTSSLRRRIAPVTARWSATVRSPKLRRRRGSDDTTTPRRTCIGCRQTHAKVLLIRLVRGADGRVRVDPDGAAAGRGAYACSNEACLGKALVGGRLAHALRGSSQPPAESAAVILETWRRR
jgi:predicted RNA-binding protein YlxR (DUF448 family)